MLGLGDGTAYPMIGSMQPDPVDARRGRTAGDSPTARQLWHEIASDQPMHAARLGLRTRSHTVREALALAASGGTLGEADLLDLVRADALPDGLLARGAIRWLAALALTWTGQPAAGGLDAAARTYLAIWDSGAGQRLGPPHHRVAAQSLFLTGRLNDLTRLLPAFTRLPGEAGSFLATDLANPYAGRGAAGWPPDAARQDRWERLLSRPFTEHGLAGLTLRPAPDGPGDGLPFDRLAAAGPTAGSVDGPPVTVIMPCYRPDEGLLGSVASICAQTYGPLQVLLVDDASGPASSAVFERALALDDRAGLIRLPENGGTYLARNAGLDAATGLFVTFQDADDWSHPERIAAQVALLREDREAPASHSLAVRAHDDLTHQWLGYPPVRVNASSLLVRSEVVDRLGPFLPVRKGADSEYAERIAAEVGPVPDTGTPLAVTRLRTGSLSRSDFSYQWAAPDRLSYRGAYRAWLRAGRPGAPPVPVTFLGGRARSDRVVDRLDLAYLADFAADPARDPGPAAGLWAALAPPDTGRVGLWHLEAPGRLGAARSEMHQHWFDRIVADPLWQAVTRVEPLHVKRLVVLDPAALLLADGQECRVGVDRVEVHLDTPCEGAPDGAGPALDREHVASVVRRWFGVAPAWVSPPDGPGAADRG